MYGGFFFPRTRVVTAAGNFTIGYEDVLVVNKSSGAATTVNLPKGGQLNRAVIIKDGKGDAGSNNITIDGDGSETIDGATTLVISTNYQAKMLLWNGTQWNVVSGS